ncbi:DUF1707 domain-containing protein [Streptomyces sp. 15-116A]|uniref:DUF1707 SHOCT-like domain-containing protein n=1 Tax=Streptomyces sp. 15-116A TaxID=2259035 RepID=UPI0021B1FF21|nr:DUF1707 domain-containing protein [Streptomyces sp. 15-116A]MCT7355246.1 DUF1707 domain-containing protein [Streptomyces sp. 15-116A]
MDLQKHASQQDSAPKPEMRASDADRDRIADLLRDALAEGRLTAEEHADRVEGVLAAKTVGELEAFVRDLPAAQQRRATPESAPNRPTPGAIPMEPDDNVVAVLSAATRKGRWRAGRRIHAYAIFGSVEIDLSEALFDHQQVVVKAFAILGNVEVRVPENVSLRGIGGGVFGNFEVHTLDADDPEAPVVYVDGWSILGNVEARPKRGKLVGDILDRVQRSMDRAQRSVDRSMRKHLGH